MKKDLNIKGRNFLLTLTILAGCLGSCEKVEVEPTVKESMGKVIVRPQVNDNRGGGDDEEDPIIVGIVENGNGIGVINAQVEIFEIGDTVATDTQTTDISGEFEMTVAAGNYFFKVTFGPSVTTTNPISITQDSNVVITI